MKKYLLIGLLELVKLLVGLFLVLGVMGALLTIFQPWVAYVVSFITVYCVGYTAVHLLRNLREKARH